MARVFFMLLVLLLPVLLKAARDGKPSQSDVETAAIEAQNQRIQSILAKDEVDACSAPRREKLVKFLTTTALMAQSGVGHLKTRDKTVMKSFVPLFGFKNQDGSKTSYYQSAPGEVEFVFNKVKMFASGLSEKKVKIFCGDQRIQIFKKDEVGNPDRGKSATLVDTTWPYVTTSRKRSHQWAPSADAEKGRKYCNWEDGSGYQTWTIAQLADNVGYRITLCESFWEDLNDPALEGKYDPRSIRSVIDNGLSLYSYHNFIHRIRLREAVLFHEFSHMAKPKGTITDKAYYWDACIKLSAADALKNADSYARLATNWYLQIKGRWVLDKKPTPKPRGAETRKFKGRTYWWKDMQTEGGFWRDWSKGVLRRKTLEPPADDGELREIEEIEERKEW
ncbi:MAG: hypothetical protein Q9227_004682 [Pyrenula ochraceoflavens]